MLEERDCVEFDPKDHGSTDNMYLEVFSQSIMKHTGYYIFQTSGCGMLIVSAVGCQS